MGGVLATNTPANVLFAIHVYAVRVPAIRAGAIANNSSRRHRLGPWLAAKRKSRIQLKWIVEFSSCNLPLQ
jgi:hypothetical protein